MVVEIVNKHGLALRTMLKEQPNYNTDGTGACRHCQLVFVKKDRRNLLTGYLDEADTFQATAILVSPTALRCPVCFTRHQFHPFQGSDK